MTFPQTAQRPGAMRPRNSVGNHDTDTDTEILWKIRGRGTMVVVTEGQLELCESALEGLYVAIWCQWVKSLGLLSGKGSWQAPPA